MTEWQGLLERFWAKVNKAEGLGPTGNCWEWTAHLCNGYGMFRIGEKYHKAHRVAWWLETDKWPRPLACHHCDNRACVRFEHLFEGTHDDNMHDKVIKGRQVRGSLVPHAKLHELLIPEIRTSPLSDRKLAAKLGVSHTTVGTIRRRKAWMHA